MTMGEQIVELRTELKAHCVNGKATDDAILAELKDIRADIKSLDKRFAGKWTEKITFTLLGLFVTTIIGLVVYIL